MTDVFSHLNYGFIGSGSLCQALVQGFLQKARIPKEKIFLSSRTSARLKKVADRFSVQAVSGNAELVSKSQIIFLCVKPEDLESAMEPLVGEFNPHQTLVSFLAGVSLKKLKKRLPEVDRLVRVVANTPVSVGEGFLAYSLYREPPGLDLFIEDLFSPLGEVLKMEEGQLSAFTVASSSGVGFVLELMQYWKEWLEKHQIPPDLAGKISTQTFFGTSLWAKAFPNLSFSDLQSRVAVKRGITETGIKTFNEAQLDSILHYGFEKAILKEKKISQDK